jgi:catecholate siderophore receptor
MYQNIFPGAVDATASQVNITAYNNRIWRKNLFNQTDLTWELHTGPVKHAMLGGGEIGRQRSDAYRNTGFFNNSATSVNVPVTDPLTTGIPITFRQSATDADAHTTATVAGVFIQDQIEFIPQLLAVAGVRLDHFKLAYHNNRTGADLSRADQLISPRLALIIKPVRPVSIYGSYGVSHLPSSGAQFTSLTVTTQTLEPEKFNNFEIGAKWEPIAGLSIAASVYRLDRTNTSAPDPADPAHTIQTGSQRSKGLEASVAGNITRAWQALAGYHYQDVAVTSRTNNAFAGQVPALVPRHTLSVWNRYQLTPAVGAGLGLMHQSRMFAAIDDAVVLPGFTRADAAAYFRLSNRISAQVNVENLFNVRYYATANSNNNITPGGPRAVRAGVTVSY